MSTISKREGKKGTSYRAEVRIKGFPLQSKSFKRLTDAKDWAQKTEADLKSGQVESTLETARSKTLQDVIDAYREQVLPTKAASSQRAAETYLKFWESELGKYGLTFIKADKINKIMGELEKAGDTRRKLTKGQIPNKPKSRKTLKHYRDMLDILFKQAIQWGWIGFNPMDRVNRITKANVERVRYLSDDEREAILTTCRNSPNKLLYMIVVFALSSGARKNEIATLTVNDIFLKERKAILRDTKNGETRMTSVIPHLKDMLEDQIKKVNVMYDQMENPPEKRWLFPRKDGMAPHDFRKAWENARDKAGLIDFRFHDLRHSTASYLAMNEHNPLEIAEVLGHKTLQMVKRYSHLSPDRVQEITDPLNDLFE